MKEVLNQQQIEQFIREGYVRIDNAFSRRTAEEGREILWRDLDCNRDDPSTWTRPVIRLGGYADRPFAEAANTPTLHSAFNTLVGTNRWMPPKGLGTFAVRFPSSEDPGDTGRHVDASFPGQDPANYMEWRINVRSKGRALLMLFLFSDVEEGDAPTRIMVGSHLDVARLLEPAGYHGMSFMELAGKLEGLPDRGEALAVGEAGTVYLCHPLLAHAAQPHRGTAPRFLAQPPLYFRDELNLDLPDAGFTPLEEAVRLGLAG